MSDNEIILSMLNKQAEKIDDLREEQSKKFDHLANKVGKIDKNLGRHDEKLVNITDEIDSEKQNRRNLTAIVQAWPEIVDKKLAEIFGRLTEEYSIRIKSLHDDHKLLHDEHEQIKKKQTEISTQTCDLSKNVEILMKKEERYTVIHKMYGKVIVAILGSLMLLWGLVENPGSIIKILR